MVYTLTVSRQTIAIARYPARNIYGALAVARFRPGYSLVTIWVVFRPTVCGVWSHAYFMYAKKLAKGGARGASAAQPSTLEVR
jgi:hypothetical protein